MVGPVTVLVDPFLMCNDGFMPRISPLGDFRRLWKGSKWPIGIQIRAKGGESRFIFFLLARGQYHTTFTFLPYCQQQKKVEKQKKRKLRGAQDLVGTLG